jgi:hypothetical protein
MPHERIELSDTPLTSIAKLSEGNPGAVSVLVDMFQRNAEIDLESVFGPMSSLFHLDTLGIYGSKIWTLFKNCCGSDTVSLVTVLRAVQLGVLSPYDLREAIKQQSPLDIKSLLTAVQAELPEFAKKGTISSEAV